VGNVSAEVVGEGEGEVKGGAQSEDSPKGVDLIRLLRSRRNQRRHFTQEISAFVKRLIGKEKKR